MKKTKLLAFFHTVRIAAQPAVITFQEYFREAGVVATGFNFETQFLGLEVAATEETDLKLLQLTKKSPDAPILAELGDKAEISVLQFRAFLAEHRRSGEKLLCCLRGKDGGLWVVHANWLTGLNGWGVGARAGAWSSSNAGNLVLSQV